MDISKIKYIYFLGIGGIGMSALARYFFALGVNVYGYDKTKTPLTKELENSGMIIHYDENTAVIPNNIDVVVYTPAIPKDNKEYLFFLENKISIIKRSELLEMITKDFFTIAVSGTHGKTSITSMIAHILKVAGKNVNAFIGGIAKNYESNLVMSSKKPDIVVVEADEFDRSFLKLFPNIAVISAMDADHLDIYENKNNLQESFYSFTQNIKNDGQLLLKSNLKFDKPISVEKYFYSLEGNANFFAYNIKIKNSKYIFSLQAKEQKIENIQLGIPGRHNVENAVAASAVAMMLNIKSSFIKEALESYSGVQRRFDYRINNNNTVFIDDYAHHPEELKACISSVKELFSNKKVTGIFQPHLYSRTRDLADDFARSLELLDELMLMDIYPARELPIDGIDSTMLLNKINIKNKMLCSKEKILSEIKKRNIEVLLTLGAGDIDQLIEPIEKILITKNL